MKFVRIAVGIFDADLEKLEVHVDALRHLFCRYYLPYIITNSGLPRQKNMLDSFEEDNKKYFYHLEEACKILSNSEYEFGQVPEPNIYGKIIEELLHFRVKDE